MLVSSYHFLQGPLIAVVALGVIVLLCRWVFSTEHRTPRAVTPDPDARPDFGLLQVICSAPTAQDAAMLQSLLKDAGIRSTVSAHVDEVEVLVFHADAARARSLVAS